MSISTQRFWKDLTKKQRLEYERQQVAATFQNYQKNQDAAIQAMQQAAKKIKRLTFALIGVGIVAVCEGAWIAWRFIK